MTDMLKCDICGKLDAMFDCYSRGWNEFKYGRSDYHSRDNEFHLCGGCSKNLFDKLKIEMSK